MGAELMRRAGRADVEPGSMAVLAKHRVQHERAGETRRTPERATARHPPIDASRQCVRASTGTRGAGPRVTERERGAKAQNAEGYRDDDRRRDSHGALDHADSITRIKLSCISSSSSRATAIPASAIPTSYSSTICATISARAMPSSSRDQTNVPVSLSE